MPIEKVWSKNIHKALTNWKQNTGQIVTSESKTLSYRLLSDNDDDDNNNNNNNNNNNDNNNIIVDVLGGWSTDVEVAVKELVGRRHKDVLKKMQKACLSATLNIARTFKLATH